jgi:hypothetical protein
MPGGLGGVAVQLPNGNHADAVVFPESGRDLFVLIEMLMAHGSEVAAVK